MTEPQLNMLPLNVFIQTLACFHVGVTSADPVEITLGLLVPEANQPIPGISFETTASALSMAVEDFQDSGFLTDVRFQ